MTATPHDTFVRLTSLELGVIAAPIIDQYPTITGPDRTWLLDHIDRRIRLMHAIDPNWKRKLEGKDRTTDPRDQVAAFVHLWVAAFVQDPAVYKVHHPAVGLFASKCVDGADKP